MNGSVAPWVRVAIMLMAAGCVALLSLIFTGNVLPSDPKQALVFQNALLLIVLGSALLEHHYTKPADSVVNSLMGGITLLSVYGTAPLVPWILAEGYCVLVFALSVTCVAASSRPGIGGWQERVARVTYRPAVVLGRSRTLFTVVFLSGLWFFFSIQDAVTIALVVFWGAFLAIWPLHIPELVTMWFRSKGPSGLAVGEIVRVDSPNIVRVALNPQATWDPSTPKVCRLPNGESFWVQPLYSQFQQGRLLATGLLTGIGAPAAGLARNCVADPSADVATPESESINEALGGGADCALVGFVVERSEIGLIRFETLNAESCREGMLVWLELNRERIYYQIVGGETGEEAFSGDRHGFQIASAAQLGTLAAEAGFKKFDWLPAMNTPVFSSSPACTVHSLAVSEGDFELGVVPNSEILVGGNFCADYNSHTAILGVTGSGKTELAFDLIRHAVSHGIKVVCIDLTAQYQDRLNDLNPSDLSVNEATSTALAEKLFAVESGTYGAGEEKVALSSFAAKLTAHITKRVEEFLTDDSGSNLGLIQLQEISNTKATLWITQLYMTCLLKYARDHLGKCPRVLVVVEEAHTVMPEPSTMGLGDYDSKGLVGKIAQIALQGRKYGVGLLILAQRTATVSKTVLTQCNTIISFTCYDDTSLGFLRNIFGPEHVALIPNLPTLQAVAFGKWVRSERPIVFQVAYDASKATGQSTSGPQGK